MEIDPALQQKILKIFKAELKEQHQLMVDGLLSIEQAKDNELKECLQVLFRASHNLKGAAKSVGIEDLATIAHRLEDHFDQWRQDNTQPQKKTLTAAFKWWTIC